MVLLVEVVGFIDGYALPKKLDLLQLQWGKKHLFKHMFTAWLDV